MLHLHEATPAELDVTVSTSSQFPFIFWSHTIIQNILRHSRHFARLRRELSVAQLLPQQKANNDGRNDDLQGVN